MNIAFMAYDDRIDDCKKGDADLETNGLFTGTIPLLSRALDLRSTRHNLIAANIANMDTPRYQAFDLMVEEALANSVPRDNAIDMRQTDARHMSVNGGSMTEAGLKVNENQYFQSVEGNTVDIDASMTHLTENSLKYNMTAQILTKKLQGLRSVIQGGGK